MPSRAMIAAILRTVQIHRLSSLQFSHSLALWAIWFLYASHSFRVSNTQPVLAHVDSMCIRTEGTVVIVTASAPRLRAICVLRKKNRRSYKAYLTASTGNKAPAYRERQELNLEAPPACKHQQFRTKYSESDLDHPLVYPERRRSRDAQLGDPGSLHAVPAEPAMELTALPQIVTNRSVV
jgi:hypothetical protein